MALNGGVYPVTLLTFSWDSFQWGNLWDSPTRIILDRLILNCFEHTQLALDMGWLFKSANNDAWKTLTEKWQNYCLLNGYHLRKGVMYSQSKSKFKHRTCITVSCQYLYTYNLKQGEAQKKNKLKVTWRVSHWDSFDNKTAQNLNMNPYCLKHLNHQFVRTYTS